MTIKNNEGLFNILDVPFVALEHCKFVIFKHTVKWLVFVLIIGT
jgi:hypothetical protein